MKRPDQYSIEEIQSLILDVCKREYGPENSDSYFIVKNSSEIDVKLNILKHIEKENEELAKMQYLDMAIYVLQVEDDVFISIV